MNRNAECFHECFLDVVSCQVTFWTMTSLNAIHVILYSVLPVQNFMVNLRFQTMLILTEVTGIYEHEIVRKERPHPGYAQVKSLLKFSSTRLNAVTLSQSQTNTDTDSQKTKLATNRRNLSISFCIRNASQC